MHSDQVEKGVLDFALTRFEKERKHSVLREELAAARRETKLLNYQHESLVRDHDHLLGILEHVCCLRNRRRLCTGSTG